MPLELGPVGPRPFLDEMRRDLEKVSYTTFQLRPLAPTIGAEIRGVDLADLDDATWAELHRAFLDYKVLVIRDQQLDATSQLAFAKRFGPIDDHPFLPAAEGEAKIDRFAKDDKTPGFENNWHSDVTWKERPPLATILRAIEVPEVGGDTLFADMTAAYRGLPDELREQVDDLQAVHDFTHTFGLALKPDVLAEKQREFPPVAHPVARKHPETGAPALFVNRTFTDRIEGLPEAEGNALLERLCHQAEIPEYQCRVRWEPGSVTLWDNRSVQHYAANDYYPRRRVMERVTVTGDRPT